MTTALASARHRVSSVLDRARGPAVITGAAFLGNALMFTILRATAPRSGGGVLYELGQVLIMAGFFTPFPALAVLVALRFQNRGGD